jgi:hypothetical protein
MIPIPNSVKYDLLKPLLDRSDVRNWTVRAVPAGTALYQFAESTPEIQFHAEHVDLTGSIRGDVPDPLQAPGGLNDFPYTSLFWRSVCFQKVERHNHLVRAQTKSPF